jgi:tetratricopeptide (TPR) repeat protein
MSNDHEFIERTRRWSERPIDPAFQPCKEGPLFATLLESLRVGLPLDPADHAHVAECPRCRRTFEFLQRLSDEDSDAGDISTSSVIRPGREPRPALQRLRASHRVRWLAGLATAAAVGMALLWMFVDSGSHRAEASCLLCEVGFAAPLVGALAGPDGSMPADPWEWNARIAAFRAERDALVAAGDAAIAAAEAAWAARVAALRAGQIDRSAGEFALAWIHFGAATDQAEWQPWVQIYRNLFAAGRFAEATAELDAFLEFGRQRDQTLPGRYSMYASALFEKGERCAALGDMEAAWEWHLESLAVRREHIETALLRPAHPEARPHRRESAEAAGLYPSLAALSMLAATEGDLPLARDYHRQAEQKLAAFFVAESRYQGVPVPPGGTLVDLSLGVVSNADHGSVSLIVKVREHLFRTARLHRMGRDLDAAERALDDSRRIGEALDEHRRTVNKVVRVQAEGGPVPSDRLVPDPEGADESRLDFAEPMERLRIAIAREDFEAAVRFAALAARHTGGRTFTAPPTGALGTPPPHPPIGVLARAELDYLHGVALAGLHQRDSEDDDAPVDPAALRLEALRVIDSAIDTIDRLAATLPEGEREEFLKSFADWRSVRDRILSGGDSA